MKNLLILLLQWILLSSCCICSPDVEIEQCKERNQQLEELIQLQIEAYEATMINQIGVKK